MVSILSRNFTIFVFVAVELHISNTEKNDLIADADLREKIVGTRKRKANEMAGQDQAVYEKLNNELRVLREEMFTLRQEVIRSGLTETDEAALGFSKEEFLAMSPTKSLQWVTTTLAPRLKQESNRFRPYFSAVRLMAMPAEMVVWTCAGFNRGTQCKAKWHIYERPNQSSNGDMRLHCCTLCYDGLGVLSEHRLLDCPWLKESNWIEIRGGLLKPEALAMDPSSPTSLGSDASSVLME